MLLLGAALLTTLASTPHSEQERAVIEAWTNCIIQHVEVNAKTSNASADILVQYGLAACQNEERAVSDLTRQVHNGDSYATKEAMQLLRDWVTAMLIATMDVIPPNQ